MPPTRDQVLAAVLVLPVFLILACLWPVSLWMQGRPFFYVSERAGKDGSPFRLLKLRTMPPRASPECVFGGASAAQVGRFGHWLRQLRLDELPQIVNVLRGEMVFIGPRPPLVRYIRTYPDIYLPLLETPPGVTGLATVYFCRREVRLLSEGSTVDDVAEIYRRRCIRQKARLDRIFSRRRGFGLTLLVLVLTVWRTPHARRVLRRWRHGIERSLKWRRRCNHNPPSPEALSNISVQPQLFRAAQGQRRSRAQMCPGPTAGTIPHWQRRQIVRSGAVTSPLQKP